MLFRSTSIIRTREVPTSPDNRGSTVLGSEFGQEFAQDCFIYCAVQLTKRGCVFSRLPDSMSCMKSLGLFAALADNLDCQGC